MGPPSEVTGGICQDLASFAIFFDLREAHFQRFSPRIEADFRYKLIYIYENCFSMSTAQQARGPYSAVLG